MQLPDLFSYFKMFVLVKLSEECLWSSCGFSLFSDTEKQCQRIKCINQGASQYTVFLSVLYPDIKLLPKICCCSP